MSEEFKYAISDLFAFSAILIGDRIYNDEYDWR